MQAVGALLPYVCNRSSSTGDCYPSAAAPYAHLISDDDKVTATPPL